MYLIGFFASPLPYIALMALYLSGFAYMGLRGQAPVAAREAPANEDQGLPEICESTPAVYDLFFSSSDGPEDLVAESVCRQTRFYFPALPACHRVEPPEHLRSTSLSAHPIRPPPAD